VSLILSGCADEGSGPQFASDPRPTTSPAQAVSEATPLPLPSTETPPPVATPASVADLLVARGAGTNVFQMVGDSIWQVASSGEATRVFGAPERSALRAIDAAPSGNEVAAVLETEIEGRQTFQITILDDVGNRLMTVENVASLLATPSPEGTIEVVAIDWSPQGDRLLVASRDNDIVVLPRDDTAEPITLKVDAGTAGVIEPAWSPTGQQIAFLATDESGRQGLQVLDVSSGDVFAAVAPDEGRVVVEFAWMPNGVSLLFTEGGEPGSAITGIDLWSVDADGDNRQLVASAGTVAPVARIANVRPSPDGRSVAYSVLVPGAGRPQVDSVWVRDLASRLGFKIALPTVAAVDDIWWTDAGLVFGVRTAGTRSGTPPSQALLLADRSGAVRALWAAPIRTATPVAAIPDATPAVP
jgi:Tol biopolymer transport system component